MTFIPWEIGEGHAISALSLEVSRFVSLTFEVKPKLNDPYFNAQVT
jgi:hypothetical protein